MSGDAALFPDPTPPTAAGSHVRAGIGGWTYAPWRNNFYPAGLVQRRELEFASRTLTAIEINGTWYGAQKPATYARWRDETPEGFVFSLKAPRYATAAKRLATSGAAIDDFVADLGAFGDRLGPVLWQFEPSRRFDPDDFAAFLERLPDTLGDRRLRHVLEVRHPGFACPAFIELARAHARPLVFTDSPDYPSFADLTGDFVYLRLMNASGHETTGYPAHAITAWAQRARLWCEGGEPDDLPRVLPAVATAPTPRDVFVYFINGAKARAPHAAMALLRELTGR